jgi:hypothetical protein
VAETTLARGETKLTYGKLYRGFESPSLRQNEIKGLQLVCKPFFIG